MVGIEKREDCKGWDTLEELVVGVEKRKGRERTNKFQAQSEAKLKLMVLQGN